MSLVIRGCLAAALIYMAYFVFLPWYDRKYNRKGPSDAEE